MSAIAKGLLEKLPALGPWKWALLLFSLLSFYQVRLLHLDERVYFWLKTAWHPGTETLRGLRLPEYRVLTEALAVETVDKNLSGLAYDERRDRFWAVVNNPEELIALGKEGEFLGRYPLSGFADVEDLAYLGDDLLLVIEERSQALLAIPVPERPGPLFRSDARSLTLSLGEVDNNGFEGVGYDRAGDRLFVAKEHSPIKLYEIRGLKASLDGAFGLQVIDREAWVRDLPARDLSAVHFDAGSGHLVLLSDESKLLMELDRNGRLIGLRSLFGGFAGLDSGVPQAEGMTFDERGNLYLVSEPNLFYAFGRGGRSAAADQPDTGDDQ